jgi:lysophospholipase L1-like esterase
MKPFLSHLSLAFLLGACLVAVRPAHGAVVPVPQMHPKAAALPFTHQGPFVNTADGGVLCLDAKSALRTTDEGRTWTSTPLFAEPDQFSVRIERALLRTRDGVIISAWPNETERRMPQPFAWGASGQPITEWFMPTYVCRSLDDGRTWETPLKIADNWCGCIHSMIETRAGRIVLVSQEITPDWRHATFTLVSDDKGRTWRRSNLIDYKVGRNSHAGTIEGSVVERTDGTLYMLLRTEAGFLWECVSRDGLEWSGLKQTTLPSVTCCPQLARLSDGRIALLWNRPARHLPDSKTSRAELSLAFSSDECATWSEPRVIAARYEAGGKIGYPYLHERRPGELWITTMQGGVRMKIATADIAGGEVPAFTAGATAAAPAKGGIVVFGDSTSAPRTGKAVKLYAQRIQESLQSIGSSVVVHNASVGGSTTRDARQRFAKDVLALQPRLIVMQFGINDAAVDVWKKPPATQPRVPLADFEANLRAMVAQARGQKARVILMTTNPLRWTPKLRELYGKPPYQPDAEDGFEQPFLASYNETVRKLAKELGAPLVDVRAAYEPIAAEKKTVDAMIPDGMHPGDSGHELVARLLMPLIEAEVQ